VKAQPWLCPCWTICLNKKVLTIVTTHYSELKSFAYEHDGMENASVEFDPTTLRPTYKLLMGVPGSSNAFYISKRLGLAPEILDQAQSLIGAEHANMENVLQNLEGERREYESRNKDIENLQLEAEHLRNELHYQRWSWRTEERHSPQGQRAG